MVALPAELLSLKLMVPVMVALPAVLLSMKLRVPPVPPELLVMVALPAVLLALNMTKALLLLVMVALPAVLAEKNASRLLLMMVALPPLMTMPAPVRSERRAWSRRRRCRPRRRR